MYPSMWPCCQGLLTALRSLHNAVTKMRRSWMTKFWQTRPPRVLKSSIYRFYITLAQWVRIFNNQYPFRRCFNFIQFSYVNGWRHGWQHMLWTRPWQRAHFVPAEGSNAYTSKSAPQASDCQLCARRYVLLFICFYDVSGTAKFSIAGLPKFGCTWLGHPAPLLHCGQVHVQNRSVSMQHRDVPLRRPLACPKGADTLTKTQILSFSDFFQGTLGTPFQPEPPRFSHISRSR